MSYLICMSNLQKSLAAHGLKSQSQFTRVHHDQEQESREPYQEEPLI